MSNQQISVMGLGRSTIRDLAEPKDEDAFSDLVGVFSAQGNRFMPAVGVRMQGPLRVALVSLPEFTFGAKVREELGAARLSSNGFRTAMIGEGALGKALARARDRIQIPLFGASVRDRDVLIPSHPEFESWNLSAGGGVIGMGMWMPSRRGFSDPSIGFVVPLPGVVSEAALEAVEGQVSLSLFRDYVKSRFDDPLLELSLDRLMGIANQRFPGSRPQAYELTQRGPAPRWTY